MRTESLQNQLTQLDKRVAVLEKRTIKAPISLGRGWSLKDWFYTGGWFIVTVSGLVLLQDWSNGDVFSISASIGLILGLAAVAHSSELLGVSDSTKVLMQEHRAQRKTSATTLHRSSLIRSTLHPGYSLLENVRVLTLSLGVLLLVILASWSIFTQISAPELQILALILSPAILLLYGMYARNSFLINLNALVLFVMLLLVDASLVSLILTTLLALGLTLYSYNQKNWHLLLGVVVGGLAVLIAIATQTSNSAEMQVAVLAASLLFSVSFSIPFVFHRREIANRTPVKAILLVVCGYTALLPIILKDYLSYQNWGLGILLLLFVFSGFSALSLAKFGRYSYAKYYGLAVILLLMVSVTALGSDSVLVLSWFILSILLLTAGFTLSSYTLRVAGLGVLSLSIAYYAQTIFPEQNLIIGPVILEERVWIGGILAVFLPVLALWYKELPVTGLEKEQKPFIIQALYSASFILLAGLTWVGFEAPTQTIALLVLGGIVVWWGLRQLSIFLQSAGIALVIVSLGKLLLVDSLSLPIGIRFTFLLIISIGLIVSGLRLTTYFKLQSNLS